MRTADPVALLLKKGPICLALEKEVTLDVSDHEIKPAIALIIPNGDAHCRSFDVRLCFGRDVGKSPAAQTIGTIVTPKDIRIKTPSDVIANIEIDSAIAIIVDPHRDQAACV